MKIAILVPSRERMNRRLTLIMSVLATVKDINNINIYIGVDEDDPTRETIKKIAKGIPCVKIVDIKNDGKFIGLGKMWNLCVAASNEEIISMIGDDMVFVTPNWDEILLQEFASAPKDGIWGVHCNDGFHGPKLAVNFFCFRKYAELMNGKFMREEFKINWIDQWLHQIFESVNRLKYRGDIMIEHRHWVLGKDKKDKVADRMAIADVNKISDQLWYDLVQERIKDVKTISNYLNITPNWNKVDTKGGNING